MVHISLVETLQVNELHGKWKNKGCRSWRELEALSWVSSSCHQTFIPDGQRSGFFIGGGCALLVCLRHLEVAKRKKEYCGKELQSEHLELEDTVTPILRFLPLSLKKSVQWLSGLRVWCCDCCASGAAVRWAQSLAWELPLAVATARTKLLGFTAEIFHWLLLWYPSFSLCFIWGWWKWNSRRTKNYFAYFLPVLSLTPQPFGKYLPKNKDGNEVVAWEGSKVRKDILG